MFKIFKEKTRETSVLHPVNLTFKTKDVEKLLSTSKRIQEAFFLESFLRSQPENKPQPRSLEECSRDLPGRMP